MHIIYSHAKRSPICTPHTCLNFDLANLLYAKAKTKQQQKINDNNNNNYNK